MPTETGLKPPRPLAKTREADPHNFNVAAPDSPTSVNGYRCVGYSRRRIAVDADFGDYWCWAGE
jgi:hypothetical protein